MLRGRKGVGGTLRGHPTSLIEQILGDVRDPRRLLPYFATDTAPAALISWLAAEEVA